MLAVMKLTAEFVWYAAHKEFQSLANLVLLVIDFITIKVDPPIARGQLSLWPETIKALLSVNGSRSQTE